MVELARKIKRKMVSVIRSMQTAPKEEPRYIVHPTAQIERTELVVIKDHAEIKDYVIIKTHDNPVIIGQYTLINPFTVIYGGSGVTIGDNVIIEPHCMLAASNHDYRQTDMPMRFAGDLSKGPIIIEDDVWIGAHVTLTDGVRVGKGAVVAANSVVTKDVRPYDIVAGIPAQKISNRLEPAATVSVGTANEETRKAWVAKVLEQIPQGLRLLDAGAGEQYYRQFCSHLTYVSQDFAQYNGTGDGTGLQMGKWDYGGLDIISDITAIPEPDGSFDVILCTEVFEHLPDPLSAIREFSRLLKKGGKLILTAPFCSLTHFAPYHYSTGFSRYYYEKHLPENGLRIDTMTENGNFFEYLAQEIRRMPSMAQRFCNQALSFSDEQSINTLLHFLEKLSKEDRGSQEILNHGYHVIATKV